MSKLCVEKLPIVATYTVEILQVTFYYQTSYQKECSLILAKEMHFTVLSLRVISQYLLHHPFPNKCY